MFEELDKAHVSWRVYSTVSPTLLFKYVRDHADGHVVPTARYYTDAAAGKLPQVAFVDPEFFGDIQHESDEHPPANPQLGQKFTSGVINALMKSPNWPTSALFLTWDEHGGYYDHVVPPAAPIPDNHAQIGDPDDTKAKFNQYGIRVPALVVSPFSRPHFVSHVVHDHTSILRTIELRFGLPALTNRDAKAAPMTEFLDFSNAAFATPPTLPGGDRESQGRRAMHAAARRRRGAERGRLTRGFTLAPSGRTQPIWPHSGRFYPWYLGTCSCGLSLLGRTGCMSRSRVGKEKFRGTRHCEVLQC